MEYPKIVDEKKQEKTREYEATLWQRAEEFSIIRQALQHKIDELDALFHDKPLYMLNLYEQEVRGGEERKYQEIKDEIEKIESLHKIIIDFLTESTPENELPIADAIFVFGHYDPRLALHAAHLYKIGKAKKIILSGKGRDKIPSGFLTEADFYASLIEMDGVPRSALVLERESTNTLENVQFGINACEKIGFSPKSLIQVAMPPLLRRSCATFRKQFPDIAVYGSAFKISEEEYLAMPRRLKRIIAEFDRLKEYADKGDIVDVQIPDVVAQALQEIRKTNSC